MEKKLGIGWFAQHILGKPLYPYQEEVGDAILASIQANRGDTITVMLARQMGKNQLSAVLEAYLLFAYEQGSIVKAAPTYKPQIVNSRMRLMSMLEAPILRERVWKSFGYIIGLAPDSSLVDAQTGPRILFFSAGPESSIVGATASLLLEIDEAQDVQVEKYDVELKPMAATNNATTVMYGTAWTDDTLLARMRAHNLEREAQDGIQRHFEFDWQTLAQYNDKYKHFVEKEMQRLGEDHISIRTQYRLLPISGAGFLLNELQRHMIRGAHHWQDEPEAESFYIAGLDVGGENRPKPGDETKPFGKRDSTVLSIARVTHTELNLPRIEIVHQQWWTGMKSGDQYAAVSELIEQWDLRKLIVDSTGLGEMLASLLIDRFGEQRVIGFKFTRGSKSKLTYQLLNMINSARFKLYSQEQAPPTMFEECQKQVRLARYSIPAEDLLNMYVNPEDGHDDFLISLALCTEAIHEYLLPVMESVVVKPKKRYGYGGKF